ncbi:MAG: sulfatase family protein [Planctomycetota bacterium]|jgi:arylsulfatase A-like enzyme
MTRREFLRTLSLAIGASAFVNSSRAGVASRKPNIIFIFADDHASEAISAYGSYLKDYAKTPNIDRLAKEGMLFRNCLCNNSICSPSRASILTGQYSHKNGVRGLNGTINENSPWFSKELQKAGYQTAVVGKWHLRSWPQGFDRFWVTKGQGRYFNPTFYTEPDGGKVSETGYSTDVYTNYALRWLQQRDPEKPFLLCLQFKAPHHPYDYAERHDKLLEGVEIPEPPNLYEDIARTSPRLKNGRGQVMEDESRNGYYGRHIKDTVPPMPPHDAKNRKARVAAAYQHMVLKYIRCITANDEAVGRILKYLDDKKLSNNTIVVYTSDQGYWLGQHGLYDKRLILEESLKMPLLVRYPRAVKAGSVCRKIAMNNDFGPTFLDYAGVAIPEAMQGVSLRPLLEGKPPADWRTDAFYCYWSKPSHWGVRTERYTLAHFPGTDEFEFYDNQKDPWQMINEAVNPAYAPAIADCEQRLARLVREIDFSPDDYPGAKVK